MGEMGGYLPITVITSISAQHIERAQKPVPDGGHEDKNGNQR